MERVHCTRFILSRDDMVGKKIPDDMIELSNTSELRYDVVERTLNVREAHDEITWFARQIQLD